MCTCVYLIVYIRAANCILQYDSLNIVRLVTTYFCISHSRSLDFLHMHKQYRSVCVCVWGGGGGGGMMQTTLYSYDIKIIEGQLRTRVD